MSRPPATRPQTLAFVNDYDAIVLDLALPDRNGLTVLQALRKEGKTTPVY